MGLNKNGILSPADKALAVETGKQVEAAMRRVMWEDRMIRDGRHREFDEAELTQ